MYKQGDIVLIPVPFTDLSSSKKRPVLILSSDSYNKMTEDIIVAAITSNIEERKHSKIISNNDLTGNDLPSVSCVRSDKLYTLSKAIVVKKYSSVRFEFVLSIIKMINNIFVP